MRIIFITLFLFLFTSCPEEELQELAGGKVECSWGEKEDCKSIIAKKNEIIRAYNVWIEGINEPGQSSGERAKRRAIFERSQEKRDHDKLNRCLQC